MLFSQSTDGAPLQSERLLLLQDRALAAEVVLKQLREELIKERRAVGSEQSPSSLNALIATLAGSASGIHSGAGAMHSLIGEAVASERRRDDC